MERNKPTVGRDGWGPRVSIALDSGRRHRYEVGRSGNPVADEDVGHAVGIAGNEVGRERVEHDKSSVAGNPAIVRVAIRLGASRRDGHPLSRSKKRSGGAGDKQDHGDGQCHDRRERPAGFHLASSEARDPPGL